MPCQPALLSAFLCFCLALPPLCAQPFYFGADLSYVNEMEDCGVVYKEDGQPKDPYQIFAGHNCNLVRLRLWHTPSWYDTLNAGHRYSGLADVKRSIARARGAGMAVLLDFHLSDFWADPSRQWVPAAWAGVVDDLPLLQDSLYNYIYATLMELHAQGLLPEMVQLGNETNRGILLSQEVNDAGWVLDWDRNAALFNTGLRAIRDAEQATGQPVKAALHIAGPSNAPWFFGQFIQHGVTDFDIMGISYYWAWHRPTSIEETGAIIAGLRSAHPGYEVMIFETGYIWTLDYNDNAANIITATHPDYQPISPETQKQWLIDLAQSVMDNGGTGMIYWEPAWVSSPCYTPWGQGSHQEHAAFFDFDTNLLSEGGIGWMEHAYAPVSSKEAAKAPALPLGISLAPNHDSVLLRWDGKALPTGLQVAVFNSGGSEVASRILDLPEQPAGSYRLPLPSLPAGIYFVIVSRQGQVVAQQGVWVR